MPSRKISPNPVHRRVRRRPPARASTRALTVAAALALGVASLSACGPSPRGNERWVTTENTNVEIDWDAIQKAYLAAEGPEDLERRVNELYTGDEIISIAVHDLDAGTQVVTGFFDHNHDGVADDGEKIFSIQREVVGDGQGEMQIQGHGHYAAYRSPMWDIASGMLLGSMISRAFMPSYRPMYVTPYTTSPARASAIKTQRSTYRAQNPSKFSKSSRSGRSYGAKGGAWGSKGQSTPTRTRSFGGGRFGRGARGQRQVVRLTT